MRWRRALLPVVLLLTGASPATVDYIDLATAFDRVEEQTRGETDTVRVAAVRVLFDRLMPGLYADRTTTAPDRGMSQALTEFPGVRDRYRAIVTRFPSALAEAVSRFRKVFPAFTPPMPIVLVHSLGERDGGSAMIAGRKVMLFGADVIAKIHSDDSLQPFLDHELFHLEHARHFADCDQFWCPLWQEGLATYAAGVMTPGASDHQLMLDQPAPIRGPADARWSEALCLVARDFDLTEEGAIGRAFLGNRRPPELPARFGYYVGMRIAAEASRHRALTILTGLNDEAAHPIVVDALRRLLWEAHAPCASPPARSAITHTAPRNP